MLKKTQRVNLGVACLVALAYCGMGYLSPLLPFPIKNTGHISQREICTSVGNQAEAERLLRDTLPGRFSYSYVEEVDLQRARGEYAWESDCVIAGDGEDLLSATTSMTRSASAGEWRNHRISEVDPDGKPYVFDVGAAALATERIAEVYVPCTGKSPSYALIVSVEALVPLAGTAKENRRALASLALGTAKYTYSHARCTAPKNLPSNLPRLQVKMPSPNSK